MTLDEISEAPWSAYNWSGETKSADETPCDLYRKEDVKRLIAYGSTSPDDWDGESACVLELNDGRFSGWESAWGPTGSGFCCDAYGGDAVLLFAKTADGVRALISERARELLVEVAP